MQNDSISTVRDAERGLPEQSTADAGQSAMAVDAESPWKGDQTGKSGGSGGVSNWQGATPGRQTPGETVQQAGQSMGQQASMAIQQTTQAAGEKASQARQALMTQASSQKDRVADTLQAVAGVLQQAGQQLTEQGQGFAAGPAQRTAGAADQTSRYLREHDVEDLIGDLEGFARQRPTLFLAGAFSLGLLGARFLKSSRREMAGSSGGTGGWYGVAPRDSVFSYGQDSSTYGVQGSPAADSWGSTGTTNATVGAGTSAPAR